ncbi:unnamed protein product, partial [Polarella glacialis]
MSLAVHCAHAPPSVHGGGLATLLGPDAFAAASASSGYGREAPGRPPEFPSVPEERQPASMAAFTERSPPPGSGPQLQEADVWRLECVFAAGLAPEAFAKLPPSARQLSFQLRPGDSAAKVVGREHQPEIFAALLAHEPGLLSRVSRNHFRIEAPPEAKSSGVRVTNLSANVAVVAQRPLRQGESAHVLDGDTL